MIGYDANGQLCGELNRGNLPIFEPGLAELLAANEHRIRFVADATLLADCDLVFLSLDVPTDDIGRSDLSSLDSLFEDVLPTLAPECVLVILCQVPPGFTRQLTCRLQSVSRGIRCYYQVETLVFGDAVARVLNPERFVIGCENPDVGLPSRYTAVLDSFKCPIMTMRFESAELTKLSINVYLAASISVANTLAELCEAMGADWFEIVPALKADERIGASAYLMPGLGIAGGNLERDLVSVTTLADEKETEASVVDALLRDSRYRRDWVMRKLLPLITGKIDDPTVAVWGLAYKPNTRSTKNSPALTLIDGLGDFNVRVYDPEVQLHAETDRVVRSASALEACRGADALVIMTPWSEFSTISPAHIRDIMSGRIIVDPYRVFDHSECTSLGMEHIGIGGP